MFGNNSNSNKLGHRLSSSPGSSLSATSSGSSGVLEWMVNAIVTIKSFKWRCSRRLRRQSSSKLSTGNNSKSEGEVDGDHSGSYYYETSIGQCPCEDCLVRYRNSFGSSYQRNNSATTRGQHRSSYNSYYSSTPSGRNSAVSRQEASRTPQMSRRSYASITAAPLSPTITYGYSDEGSRKRWCSEVAIDDCMRSPCSSSQTARRSARVNAHGHRTTRRRQQSDSRL